MSWYDSKEKGICANPFYKASLSAILKHYDDAEQLYPVLFAAFISFWYQLYTQGEVKSMPPKSWKWLPKRKEFDEIAYNIYNAAQ